MNLAYAGNRQKRIVAAVLIFLLAVCIEIGFNRTAILEGYEELDLTGSIKTEGDGEEQIYVAEYQDPDGLFVKQLRLSGVFSDGEYTVTCTVQNEFQKEEEYQATDHVHAWFSDFYTNINRRVTKIRIVLPAGSVSEIRSVSLSNRAEWNKYRFVFVCVVLLLLYAIFLEPVFYRKPEYFFLLFSLSFGAVLLLCGQPQCNAWDEQTHFERAYSLAGGTVVEWNEAADRMRTAEPVKCNTKAEYAELRQEMDAAGERQTSVEDKGKPGLHYYSLGYLPSALFLKIGMGLGMPFSILLLFGRMGDLLAYVFVMFWAIRLARGKKLLLCFFSLMPTPLFLACSYTYDSVVFSFVTLGVVLWEKEMSEERASGGRRGLLRSLLSLFLILAGGMIKIVYMPVALIWLLVPRKKRMGKREKRIAGVVILAACAAAGILLFCHTLLPILNGSRPFGDARGGETDLAAQLFSMLRHPWASVKLFVREMFRLDNFRNSGVASYNNFFAGNLLFLNYYLLGVMEDKWCLVLIPVLLLLLLYREEETEKRKILSRKQRVSMLLILGLTVVLIWLSMYLTFTPVGSAQILGVQARYYLPLLYPGALIPANRNVFFSAPYEGTARMAMTAALVLEAVSLYGFLLEGRLF